MDEPVFIHALFSKPSPERCRQNGLSFGWENGNATVFIKTGKHGHGKET